MAEAGVKIMLMWFGVYLAIGLVVMVVFDLLTHRIRDRLQTASMMSQTTLLNANVMVGLKIAGAVTLLITWLFYPVLIYAALFGGKNEEQ